MRHLIFYHDNFIHIIEYTLHSEPDLAFIPFIREPLGMKNIVFFQLGLKEYFTFCIICNVSSKYYIFSSK